jgi:lanosterol synthase
MLREKPSERLRTMGFISGQNKSHSDFAYSFAAMLVRGSRDLAASGISSRRFSETKALVSDLGSRLAWLLGGTMHLTDALPAKRAAELLGARTSEVSLRTAEARYGAALRASLPRAAVIGLNDFGAHAKPRVTPHLALERAYEALALEQAEDGSFEGEVVWCAMLAAQYVLAMHALGRPLSEERKRRVLLHFERTRTPDGAWGLHPLSPPYLFVTTLVYVAARLLGVDKNDALLARAHDLIRREGGASPIPTWGKLWLAIVGLYDWKGVNPILPEVWSLPKWMPMHPSRYYCHTRNIYMGMATLYGMKFSAPVTPVVTAIRDEIFPEGYTSVDFNKTRTMLRSAEIFTPPTSALRGLFSMMNVFESVKSRGGRKSDSRRALIDDLRSHIRYELKTTHYTCLSPVNGLLDMLALHAADPKDADIEKALAAFEGWIWEDDVDGLRVAGARSASWDTAFAMQALAAAYPHASRGSNSLERAMKNTIARADAFLESQQIRTSMGDEAEHFRLDPTGGYCFAGVWHGWPVSDCTAEALLGRMESPVTSPPKEDMQRGVEFILRTQNSDGGFGSYESRRIDLPLEWMNPAEMFGDSMTEKSYVECTASCIAALATFKHRFPAREPGNVLTSAIDASIERATEQLRISQQNDGSWVGVWGIQHIYGTLFGIRGLLAAGVPAHDPAIRRACAFLKARQKPDGGWGEHYSSIFAKKYVEHRESQFVQTSWALSALLEAKDPDFACLERAANFLAEKQNADGTFDVQDPEGVFFHTALLDYVLYRRYFPLWALGLFETRRLERLREHNAPPELRAH